MEVYIFLYSLTIYIIFMLTVPCFISRDIRIIMENTVTIHIANAVSTITILSCLFLKVPQIMNIRNKHSTEGIYIEAMLMEIIGYVSVY